MYETTKPLEISADQKFQLTKLPSAEGGFILLRLLGISTQATQKALRDNPQPETSPAPPQNQPTLTPDQQIAAAEEKKKTDKLKGEMTVRTIAYQVLSSNILSIDDFKFIQRESFKSILRVESVNGNEFMLPIVTPDGRFIPPKHSSPIEGNFALQMRLVTEVLVFNFTDFFDPSAVR